MANQQLKFYFPLLKGDIFSLQDIIGIMKFFANQC